MIQKQEFDDLKERLKAAEESLGPIVDAYNKGKFLCKILVILGGILVGLATIWGLLIGPIVTLHDAVARVKKP